MKHFLVVVSLIITACLSAQNSNRKYISHQVKNDLLTIRTSDGFYEIKFYTPEIVETSFLPTNEIKIPSHAVVLKDVTSAHISETSQNIDYKSSGIHVLIQKSPLKISYVYRDKLLLSEKNGYTKNDSTETLDFNLDKSEVLYGGGARVLGMNRRGNKLQLYNRAHYGYETRSELMNFTMPIMLSSKMYMIHFDNAPIGFLDLDSQKNSTLTYETISGRKTYQVIAAESWDEVMYNYTSLTGRQPMPPIWALGNFSSRFGYHSQKEAEMTIKKFRDEKIPVDAIILDLYWFGKDVKGTMGNLEVFRDSFPKFENMIADFRKNGVKTIPVTEPFILTTSKKWEEAVAKKILGTDSIGNPFVYDFYFGNTGLLDLFNPSARSWFWNIYKDLANKGASGIWGDLGEPEVHPSAMRHGKLTADQVHNIYGHEWAKLVYEGYKTDFPSTRPFILMRSGYSGSQRFGMIPWSGDVSRSWGGLSGQTEISLQMGMQGMAYMHSDLGGFAGATLDNELYTRWLQYGVFQPIFRPHAQEDVASEPVFKDQKTKDLARESIELRYRMLPYNYTLAFENSQNGMPLMRPLLFEEPNNLKALTTSTTYLWGNDFLITPIIQPQIKTVEVVFPPNFNWFDFYTNEKHSGGVTKKIATAQNHIPVFIRGGAFIPLAHLVQTTDDYSLKEFDLHFYFDESTTNSTGKIYNDDGANANSFTEGAFELLCFSSEFINDNLNIVFDHKNGPNYSSSTKKVTLIVHNITSKPKKIIINGKKEKLKWYKKENKLEIDVLWDSQKSKHITIQLAK